MNPGARQPAAAPDDARDGWRVEYDSDVVDIDHGPITRWPMAISPVVALIEFEPGVDEEAVAHLMAAAPLLRDALAWAVEWMERWEGEVMPEWREWQARGRAALDATGPPAEEVTE